MIYLQVLNIKSYNLRANQKRKRMVYLIVIILYVLIWTSLVLEKTLESPLESKEIKPVNPKGNQPWIFIGRTDAEAEASILWPPDEKSWLIGTDARSDWREEKKVATEYEVVEWHHWLSGHDFEQALGDSVGQGSLECCIPWLVIVRHDLVTEQQ